MTCLRLLSVENKIRLLLTISIGIEMAEQTEKSFRKGKSET